MIHVLVPESSVLQYSHVLWYTRHCSTCYDAITRCYLELPLELGFCRSIGGHSHPSKCVVDLPDVPKEYWPHNCAEAVLTSRWSFTLRPGQCGVIWGVSLQYRYPCTTSGLYNVYFTASSRFLIIKMVMPIWHLIEFAMSITMCLERILLQ